MWCACLVGGDADRSRRPLTTLGTGSAEASTLIIISTVNSYSDTGTDDRHEAHTEQRRGDRSRMKHIHIHRTTHKPSEFRRGTAPPRRNQPFLPVSNPSLRLEGFRHSKSPPIRRRQQCHRGKAIARMPYFSPLTGRMRLPYSGAMRARQPKPTSSLLFRRFEV
jgi:hypothetical protein